MAFSFFYTLGFTYKKQSKTKLVLNLNTIFIMNCTLISMQEYHKKQLKFKI